jgi:selenoprotein W-related protein
LKQRFGVDARLVKKSGGIFEVAWGGELLFSKRVLGRFPNPGEVERALQGKLAGARGDAAG